MEKINFDTLDWILQVLFARLLFLSLLVLSLKTKFSITKYMDDLKIKLIYLLKKFNFMLKTL